MTHKEILVLLKECKALDQRSIRISDALEREWETINWGNLEKLINELHSIYGRQLELITIFGNVSCLAPVDDFEFGVKLGENMSLVFVNMLQIQNQAIKIIEMGFAEALFKACVIAGADTEEVTFWTNQQRLDFVKTNPMNHQTILTTRNHYEKYAALAKHVPTWVAPYSRSSKLRAMFHADHHLNNIPLSAFDAKFDAVMSYVRGHKNLSLAESCCVLKHILIYRVLGVKPIFED